MLALDSLADHGVFIGIAVVGGAFGGVVYELLLQRGKRTGALAIPRRHAGYFDLGWGASVVIGIAAALVVLYLLAPINERTEAENTVTRMYDLIKLIALSVIAGSAGPSMIGALQARVIAALEAQRADDTADVATAALDQVEASLQGATAAGVANESTRTPLAEAQSQVAAAKQAIAALRAE